ncbi:hypothetical protein JCM17844_07930 [Iodidimonas gelatinilytica]|uniref:Electron transfer flavoprotein alpha/beta-subunit N-terminal domain-containing protein n=1 Tax=Iodidimonas gelatinilytica TaxID=1236966 RepID=A0A5A7MMU2_9PROT|nr:hypothetical protein [Iodidimonas gelatinilytica]GEQ97156.1 hypothetical protein JCM17844_07930 [Iodidimonas gelatinilytica]
MTALVLAEHDNSTLNDATLSTVTAAKALDDVHILVAGHNAASVAEAAAKIDGVTKVLHADAPHYEHRTAEALSALLIGLADGYDSLLAPATTMGKNVMPRVAAALDVTQLSDIIAVENATTFKRPIYAAMPLPPWKHRIAKRSSPCAVRPLKKPGPRAARLRWKQWKPLQIPNLRNLSGRNCRNPTAPN